MEDIVGIPEDLRCKRSDGKQWRCSALSMPDKTVCEKHYIQAKRRAMNSALRASMRKASKRKSLDNSDIYLENRRRERDGSRSSLSPVDHGGESASMPILKKHNVRLPKSSEFYSSEPVGGHGSLGNGGLLQREAGQVEEGRVRPVYYTSPSSKERKNFSENGVGDYSGKSSDSSGEAEGMTCHHCQRNYRTNVVWCTSCDRKGYCNGCILKWYAEIPIEDIQKACPACRGICNCRLCLRGDNLIKAKVEGIAAIDRLRYLHSLLAFILPVLKQIYSEQCFEISMEKRIYGIKADIPRAKINADEQMCCDLCKIPIFDYHRHCSQCMYDLCLTCCRDIRHASLVSDKGEPAADKTNDKLKPQSAKMGGLDFTHLFPKWKVNIDGSIPCGPDEAGGCGFTKLILRRMFKINWTGKLLKNAEEMVNGCKGSDMHGPDRCDSYCMGTANSKLKGSVQTDFLKCSYRDDSSDNFLYYPASEDIKLEGIGHFHKFWVKGQPVIVKNVLERSLASGWEPMDIWKGVQETLDEEMNETDVIVKAIDYLSQSEVDIELSQFIKGYSKGYKDESGWPKMLKLKDWPPPSALEEFLLCHRPEFLSNFPLVEFIHSKWGLLNLVSKLPHDTLQSEAVPKIFITYGTHKELGRGDPVTKLQINMSDMACLLMHTAEPLHESAGTIWDIFRRQDVSKLNDFFRDKFLNSVNLPVYAQALYLNNENKRKLKDEFNIEPWTFQQHVGEAVFIPAGCPFQVRNLQSSVQLAFEFLSPESLGESVRMAQEIRCLPSDHEAKLKMLEVEKMSLYAASSAVREIQKIALDPRLSSEIKYEDERLTAMVSENLERVAKQRQIACL